MASYRIRSAFRVVAALVAAGGVVGAAALIKHALISGDALIAVLVAVLILVLAVPFGAIAWVGRVPARVEEFGLDDLEEVFKHRADAHSRGTFVP
jgi:hypothetical protein